MERLSELAQILGLSATATQKRVGSRLAALKLGDVCGRCCGSGNYSWNQVNGSTCFGCGGSGQVWPKDIDAAITAATALRDAGKIAEYIAYLERKAVAKRAADDVMKAWSASAVSKSYSDNWRKAAEMPATAAANSEMHNLYEQAQKMSLAIQYPKKGTTAEEIKETTLALADLRDRALKRIAELTAEWKGSEI